MVRIWRRMIFSALISIIILITGCSRIQEPAPDPTLESRSEAATAPVSKPLAPAETPSPEAIQAGAAQSQIQTPAARTPTEPSMVNTLPATCTPTPADALGPFYVPGAPIRDKVGEGYVLSGVLRSSNGCAAIAEAQIEIWMAGPDGIYRDDYRATLFSDEDGAYSFESHFPPPYSGRPSHHHLRVSADGYETLVTQHYPIQGLSEASFDVVLLPNQ